MLSTSKVMGFIPTKDAAKAKAFYEEVLGLRFVSDDQFAIVMDSNGTTIRVARVGNFTPVSYTILGWEVTDIEAAARELTGKGVVFERFPHFQQDELGIWTAPGGAAKVAWFHDPDGNTLSLSQHQN